MNNDNEMAEKSGDMIWQLNNANVETITISSVLTINYDLG